jgi:hypothetical protein
LQEKAGKREVYICTIYIEGGEVLHNITVPRNEFVARRIIEVSCHKNANW